MRVQLFPLAAATIVLLSITSAAATDMKITKKALKQTVKVGDEVQFEFTADNTSQTGGGPYPTKVTTITDQLPPEFQFVRADGAECTVDGSNKVTCQLGAMEANTTKKITVTVKALAAGIVENKGQIVTDLFDPDMSNNTDSATVTIEERAAADLEVRKVAPAGVLAGAYQTTLIVKNNGPDPAEMTKLTDIAPAEMRFDLVVTAVGTCNTKEVTDNSGQFDHEEVECDLGTLAAGDSVIVQAFVHVDEAGLVINVAVVSSTTPDPEDGNNTTSATTEVVEAGSADLGIYKDFMLESPKLIFGDSIGVGQTGTYNLEITNLGPDAATSTTVRDTLPPNVKLVSVMSTVGSCVTNNGVITCDVGTLAVADTVEIRVVVQFEEPGETTNAAEVESIQPDPVLSNNRSEYFLFIVPGTTINIEVSPTDIEGPVGAYFEHKMTITNSGSEAARNVETSAGRFEQASLSGGLTDKGICTYAVLCYTQRLAPGEDLVINNRGVILRIGQRSLVHRAYADNAGADEASVRVLGQPVTAKILSRMQIDRFVGSKRQAPFDLYVDSVKVAEDVSAGSVTPVVELDVGNALPEVRLVEAGGDFSNPVFVGEGSLLGTEALSGLTGIYIVPSGDSLVVVSVPDRRTESPDETQAEVSVTHLDQEAGPITVQLRSSGGLAAPVLFEETVAFGSTTDYATVAAAPLVVDVTDSVETRSFGLDLSGLAGRSVFLLYAPSDSLVAFDAEQGMVETKVVTDVESASSDIPLRFEMGAPYPNPFAESTTISFSTDKPGRVSLTVYDALGRKVSTVLNEELEAGRHLSRIRGSGLANGLYFAVLTMDGRTALRSLAVIK